MLELVGRFVNHDTAQSQLELLASFEAALRPALELQRHVAPALDHLDIPRDVAISASRAGMLCLDWTAEPGLQLTTDEAEHLLAVAAALACTICKCAVLRAGKAAAAGAAEAAQAGTAAAGGGAGAAGAPPMLGPAPLGLEGVLLLLAETCELLAEAVAKHAAPSARPDRWGAWTECETLCITASECAVAAARSLPEAPRSCMN